MKKHSSGKPCGARRASAKFELRFSAVATALLGLLLLPVSSSAQLILGDNYDVVGVASGFALNTGVNSGINPPTTRLTGTAAAGLRYLPTANKTNTAFSISGNNLQVIPAANPGRFSLSANGSTPFDLAAALGANRATAQNPVVYDLTISMANDSAGVQRFSFALATAEGDATTWDFGIQLYRTADSDNFYTIGKRIDTTASGLSADLNMFITNTPPGTYGTEINFLLRVTDAGSESSTFNSHVQVSIDGGMSWLYDTATDPDLPYGWRLNGSGRYILWDVAPTAGPVTYDNFSLRVVPACPAVLSPIANATAVGACPALTVALSNTASGLFTVRFFGREAPKPYAGPDFAVAVLPDTQNYARESSGVGDATKEMWFAQTEWIVTNRVMRNIAYVAQLGDIVQNGDVKNGGPNDNEWENATNAMYRLENPARTLLREGIPYGMAVGNHDQEPMGDMDGTTTNYNRFFGVSHFDGHSYYGGHLSGNNDNHFDVFSAGGLNFIVLYFEFGRYGSMILSWANDLLAAYPQHRAIVVTHFAGSDTTPSNLSAQGDAIYQGLKENTNFFMMMGGHVFNDGGEGSRANTYEGRTVRTFISNFQGRTNGGNGWMRMMYFSPSNNTVTVKTYSPWIDRYETDADSQITFPYNMQLAGGAPGTPFAMLGTKALLLGSSVATCAWPALQPNKAYDWFVTITDSRGTTVTNPPWRFTTTNNLPPVANTMSINVTGDSPAEIRLIASDPNGDALTFLTNTAPLQGMITGFDTNAGVVTYLPARGFRGSDSFNWRASDSILSSSSVWMYLNVLPPADANANGLPDAWEATYGIADPAGDPDGDGQSNLAEYRANTNPTNAASALRILSAERLPSGQLRLTWSSVGGTRYRIQYSPSFGDAFVDIARPVQVEIDPSPWGVNSTQTFTEVLSTANTARFYRIRLVP